MVTTALLKLFNRDLEKLKVEIASYQEEATIWKIDKGIANSSGNLCLHLVGNINYFIGTILGETGYIRHREFEFSAKDLPRKELIKQVEDTLLMINKVVPTLSEEVLKKDYPIVVFKEDLPTFLFLLHLTTHLTYHLGQINYHRRLLDHPPQISFAQ